MFHSAGGEERGRKPIGRLVKVFVAETLKEALPGRAPLSSRSVLPLDFFVSAFSAECHSLLERVTSTQAAETVWHRGETA